MSRVEKSGGGETFTSGWPSISNSARSSFDRFKSAVTVSTSRKPGMTRYLGVPVYHISSVHDQDGRSPISIELSQTTKQGLSRM